MGFSFSVALFATNLLFCLLANVFILTTILNDSGNVVSRVVFVAQKLFARGKVFVVKSSPFTEKEPSTAKKPVLLCTTKDCGCWFSSGILVVAKAVML